MLKPFCRSQEKDCRSGGWRGWACCGRGRTRSSWKQWSSEKAEVSYHDLYEVLHCSSLPLYSAWDQNWTRHYLLFSLELQSDQSEKDWCIFSNMGSGTRSNAWNIHSYDLAKYCCRRIGQKLLPYGLEGMLPSFRGPSWKRVSLRGPLFWNQGSAFQAHQNRKMSSWATGAWELGSCIICWHAHPGYLEKSTRFPTSWAAACSLQPFKWRLLWPGHILRIKWSTSVRTCRQAFAAQAFAASLCCAHDFWRPTLMGCGLANDLTCLT